MNGKLGIIVVIIAIAGGWYLLSGNTAKAPASETTAATSGVTVTYTDQGYSPASVTIPLGATVTFVNQSTKSMWVASAMHPAHSVYSGTTLAQHCPDTTNSSFDQCVGSGAGTSFSFTFNKEGTWKYHDHIDATKFGTVVVTP